MDCPHINLGQPSLRWPTTPPVEDRRIQSFALCHDCGTHVPVIVQITVTVTAKES